MHRWMKFEAQQTRHTEPYKTYDEGALLAVTMKFATYAYSRNLIAYTL